MGSSSSFGGMAKTSAPQAEEYDKSESSPIEPGTAPAMEIKSYDATVRTSDAKVSCDAFLSKIDRNWATVENINSGKSYCTLSVLVKKEKEEEFLASLKAAGLYDLQTRVSNIRKNYANVTDRVGELKKRLEETDALLASTKTQYDQLWEALKTKNVSAESIEALNRIITNKSELISKFSRERLSIMTEIDTYEKQKKDYEERLANVEFSVRFEKRVLVDWEQAGEAWSSDLRELASVANETVRNLTVNLGSFLLKTLNVVVYLVLGAFVTLAGGKLLYRMGRRIVFGKEEKKEKASK
ncbi:MAG: hypothetical protein WA194_09255 [Patescibacteria group bacterium]